MESLTNSLLRDHEVILRAVARLESRVSEWRRSRRIERGSLEKFIEFAKLFTDRCHHGKEERCLFPCMEKSGVPREGGPIGVMLYEHQLGRQLISRLEKAAETYFNEGRGLEEVLTVCEDYMGLIRQHIAKENDILFPMGENVATEEDVDQTNACYEEVELREVGEEEHHRLERAADEI